jgi:hypothetical protein
MDRQVAERSPGGMARKGRRRATWSTRMTGAIRGARQAGALEYARVHSFGHPGWIE